MCLTRLLPLTLHASLVTLLALSACSPTPESYSREFLSLGTTVSIEVIDTDATHAVRAIDRARSDLNRLSKEWYAWVPGELSRLNVAIEHGDPFKASAELTSLLERSQEFFRKSDGAFDPAVGALVQRWGFQASERPDSLPLPDDAELDAWRRDHPTLANLRIDGDRISSERRDLLVDLGAIGKGAAVDRAIDVLRTAGIAHTMVNAGGNLRAIGQNLGRPWRIAIRNPRGEQPIAWLELDEGEGVSTSGDYEHFAIAHGQRIHHLLDPRTGRPAVHTQAVTVIAPDATQADAASTALFVAGPDQWRTVARNLGLSYVLRVDANGTIEATQPLLSRLRDVALQSTAIVGIDLVAPQR